MAPDRFEQTLDEFEGQLIGYAYSFVGDLETARDVVQDTFLRLWNQEKEPTALKPWLFTTCRNRAIDILRKEKRIVKIETEEMEAFADCEPQPDEQAAGHDEHAKILRLLRILSDNQCEVVRLRFEAELSYREISEVTGLTEGNVGFLLHTALKKLREHIANTTTGGSSSGGDAALAL